MTPLTAAPVDVRAMFSQFPTGVVVIGARVGSDVAGMVVSSFSVGVSLSPPLVSFAAQRTSETWPPLREVPRLGISILAQHQSELCAKIASTSNRHKRFDDVPHDITRAGALTIRDASVVMEVELADEFPAGDHTLALLEVKHASADTDRAPLVFHRSIFKEIVPSDAGSGRTRGAR